MFTSTTRPTNHSIAGIDCLALPSADHIRGAVFGSFLSLPLMRKSMQQTRIESKSRVMVGYAETLLRLSSATTKEDTTKAHC